MRSRARAGTKRRAKPGTAAKRATKPAAAKRGKKRPAAQAAKRPAHRDPPSAASYDVVALVASAGGRVVIDTVLRALPEDFPVPIVVMQHFPHDVDEPFQSYARRLPFSVEWAREGTLIAPGRVIVAPPRSFVEVLPDGACTVRPCERGPRDRPFDRLLGSLARSFAHRTIAVVLSGMMDDGADGARAVRAAGGSVIVQSEAEYGEMPQAAIRSGGADVALPIGQIGSLLVDLAAGMVLPRPASEREAVEALFAGEGEARAAMRAVSWAATPLGPVREWPQALTTAVRNHMSSSFPTCILWGPELIQIYNDAFLPLLGSKPSPAGKPARLTWPEIWSSMGPRLEAVLQTGKAVHAEDQLFLLDRRNQPEESYLTYSNSPLHDADGTVRGVLVVSSETTALVRASRRLRVLRNLAAIKGGQTPLPVAENAAAVLGEAPLDVPFALLYLLDKGRKRASLAASVGLAAGAPGAPHTLLLSDRQSVWPLAEVAASEAPATVNDLPSRLPGVHAGPWTESPSSATLLPLRRGADGPLAGVAVVGLSPYLRGDPSYDDFLRLIAQHLSTTLGEAEARRDERARSDRLAELDRAKVDFFSNVSHEFRTPITLLLGPLEEMLARRASLPADLAGAVEAAARNGRRLLTLVNNLLDFSQADSHRERARLEPTDLGALTADIASAFRSAIQAAGLQFEVRCEPGMPVVPVDRQMWEKIVSNLLSNALKFTFEGKIWVELRPLSLHAELTIGDTGVGIPDHELANVFKRFHRVRGARARTAEGSGIGLWMVDDLVKRIGGQLRVQSKENAGTTFTIWIPHRSARAADEPGPPGPDFRPTEFASQLADEVSRWTADGAAAGGAPSGVLEDLFGSPQALASSRGGELPTVRILVVDDNADMREYLQRLLSPRWRVDAAADGARGFEAAVELRPDVILADVMMPGLDGFQLLERVRAHPELRYTPVVLVTARAGEEAAIEGLMAGADDYIAKPFSPRELVARVAAAVERARVEAALRKSEAELVARNQDLERFNSVTVGREQRMIELKKQINELCARLGEPPHAPPAFEEQGQGSASLNVLEDAVQARDLAERLYRELQEREVWLRGQREALAAAVNGAPLEIALGTLVRTATEALGEGARAAIHLADRDATSLHDAAGTPPDDAARWSFPIYTAAGKFVGTLAISSSQEREATAREQELASLLTHTAAIIIARDTEAAERRKVEQALRDSEARFRAFVTAGSDAVYRMSPDWSQMRELDGQGFLSDTPEPTASWMNRYIHPDDQPAVAAAIQRAIRDKTVFELEHRVLRADGTLERTLSRAIPILDARGEIVEWLGAATRVAGHGPSGRA